MVPLKFSVQLICVIGALLYGTDELEAVDTSVVRAGQANTLPNVPIWEAIVKEAQIDVVFSPLPTKRKRRSFIEGYLLLDCCHPPMYRDTPEEKATHLFTDPIYFAQAHYVFRKGEVVPIERGEDLKSYRVAGIRGFDYIWQDQFGDRIDGRDHADVLTLLEMNRADVGIITGLQFRFEMAKRDWPLELGGVMASGYLHASVHITRPDLLPKINAAIARMRADGRLDKLLLLSETPISMSTR
ncbi:substrate-binding periplasmic protein [Kordiimonas sp.]|uniref:substrate-binding periplasmic protein n=1 Tax=Kordiimonas sp. TaxID=1970157 RepID=UPI003B527511